MIHIPKNYYKLNDKEEYVNQKTCYRDCPLNFIINNNEEYSKRKMNKIKKDNQEVIKKVKEIMK